MMIWIVAALSMCATALAREMTLDQAIDAAKFDDRKASLKSQFPPGARIFAAAAQPVAPFDFVVGRGVLGVDSGQMSIPESDVKLETSATAAMVVTLLLVPVMYSICVLDLKVIRWSEASPLESVPVLLEVK